jgi:hypothetical protein
MKPLRIYIAGPMTGLPDLNRPAFAAAAEEIKAAGHYPQNPHDLHPVEVSWEQAMRADIGSLVTCDALYMLKGWERSPGAKLEHSIALGLGMPIYVERATVLGPVEYPAWCQPPSGFVAVGR